MAELTAAEVAEVNERLEALGKAGFQINNAVAQEIHRRKRPDIIQWVVSDDGRADARALHDAQESPTRSLRELDKIQGKIDRQKPFQKYERNLSPVDAYITHRRQEKRGRR